MADHHGTCSEDIPKALLMILVPETEIFEYPDFTIRSARIRLYRLEPFISRIEYFGCDARAYQRQNTVQH